MTDCPVIVDEAETIARFAIEEDILGDAESQYKARLLENHGDAVLGSNIDVA
jgi:hypothetical protein